MSAFQISVLFFLQLTCILAACRVVGWLGGKLGQPQVVGEMIAGVLLGPSLLGVLAPEMHSRLFPPESKAILFASAQVGLSLYMFLIGVEFNHDLIRSRLRSAAAVSLAGIAGPFALGAMAAWWYQGRMTLFTSETGEAEAMLFLGAAMSITAFPMLARIIYERGLTGTPLGTLSLAAGSIDDAAAWCVLAVVLASFESDPQIAALAIGGGIGYALFVLLALKPLLRPFGRVVEAAGLSSGRLAFVLMLVMLGSWFTDAVGIYAVFGAFLMGLAMPRGRLSRELLQQMKPLVTTFMLPLFFVNSGLNTRLTLLFEDPSRIGVAIVLLLCAIVGKGGACTLVARLQGEPLREALAIGALMNARGLMELIILNIGLERKIISPVLFTMMVIMAIITTLMATPLFELVDGRYRPRDDGISV